MSPVFGHGRLRLYLLNLLEESPRHGYEVIRLLQDRFLGVYSPSPGTIYPRLARLEEEGLVTHEVVDGKKVFTVTDKGRAELVDRMDELAELEQEITASVQDIAREVKEDVRQTVRSLREELTQMAKDIGKESGPSGRDVRRDQKQQWKAQSEHAKQEWRRQKDEWRRHKDHLREETERWQRDWRRVWERVSATGLPEDPHAHGAGREHPRDLTTRDVSEQLAYDAELGRLLARFVSEIREAATAGRLSDTAVAECRTALDEAAARIRDALRH
ncbi:helix-turn-helix transcriptional regulator [Microbispora sp. NPDC049125]|uniref:PadR family transcriptional regulator n=1 Tax=Microbispora sp. NPDC049125 TaxID=3154929 RepID=UPI0034664400